ncbi:MAG: L,D-transpeptidase family protein [Hyphomonadaceae bacterium]|nr:L,D-transpeptidase family protein [Hyphomonadaceae bacterium]
MAQTPEFEVEALERSIGVLRWGGREIRCALGRGGVVKEILKREGDGATPAGRWPMRQIFYRPDRLPAPLTGIPVAPITQALGWGDGPGQPGYNQLVQLPYPASHEKLWREDHVYDLIVVLGYNDDPVVSGKGSAIFLHVARPDLSPTEGCVAVAREDLLDLLKTVKPGDTLTVR